MERRRRGRLTEVLRYPVYLYCAKAAANEAILRDALRCVGEDPDVPRTEREGRDALLLAVTFARFRSVAYYRAAGPRERQIARLLALVAPGVPMEILYTEVASGLRIHHGHATVIRAQKIGKDCDIFQQVTIGYGRGGFPTLGDRVDVCAGAMVLGDIHVGDDAIVGAAAVVTKDVPAGAIVVGNPARVVGKSRGRRAVGMTDD